MPTLAAPATARPRQPLCHAACSTNPVRKKRPGTLSLISPGRVSIMSWARRARGSTIDGLEERTPYQAFFWSPLSGSEHPVGVAHADAKRKTEEE